MVHLGLAIPWPDRLNELMNRSRCCYRVMSVQPRWSWWNWRKSATINTIDRYEQSMEKPFFPSLEKNLLLIFFFLQHNGGVKKKMVVVNDHKEICILFLPLFFFVSNGLGMFSKWKFIQITPGCRTDESPSLLLCIFVVSFLGFETFLFFQQLTRNTLVRVKLKKRNFQKHTQSTKK